MGLIETFFPMKNLATELVAPEKVNVGCVQELSVKILGSIKGDNPLKFSIRKINLAKQIPTKSVALLPANCKAASAISIDPQLFLQRAISFESSDSINITLADGMEFELYPVSLPLFKQTGFIRTGQRAGPIPYHQKHFD